jgi:hypothetical protein
MTTEQMDWLDDQRAGRTRPQAPEPKIEKTVKVPLPEGLTLRDIRRLAERIDIPEHARVAYLPGSQRDPGSGVLQATWEE